MLLIAVVGVVFYIWILTRYSLVYGIDGPYYLMQLECLFAEGRLAYEDPPLAFYLLAFFSALLNDVTLGVKVGTAFFCALSAIPMYLMVNESTGKRIAGYFAMLMLILSPAYIQLIGGFNKNAVGIFFLLFFIYYLHRIAVREFSLRGAFFALLFLVLTGLCHILDFALAVLFFALYFIFSLAFYRRGCLKKFGIVASLLSVFVAAGFLLIPQYLAYDLGKSLTFLYDLFNPDAFSSPLHMMGNLDPRAPIILPLILFSYGSVAAFYEFKNKNKETAIFLSATVIIGILLLLPSSNQWRFLLMEFIPATMILSFIISKPRRPILVILLIVIFILPIGFQASQTVVRIRPSVPEPVYDSLMEMKPIVPPGSVIVVKGPIFYWVQYVLDTPTTGRITPDLWRSYDHVFLLFPKKTPITPPFPQSRDAPPIPPGEIIFKSDALILHRLAEPPLHYIQEHSS